MLSNNKRKIEPENSSQRKHQKHNNINYNLKFKELQKQFKNDLPSIDDMAIWFRIHINKKF